MSTTRIAVSAGLLIVLAACGSDGTSDADVDVTPPALEGLALEGRSVMRQNGCAACHGSNGEGSVGPVLTGLFGTEVTIEGGETVTADRAYLRESIVEPSARLVEGYKLPMPKVDLSDAEIDAIISYIEAIGPATEEAQP